MKAKMILFIAAFFLWGQAFGSAKVILAHMTNNIESAQWAIEQGANGVELDLRFDMNGNPVEFRHGGLCDCTCIILNDYTRREHVCGPLGGCEGNETASTLLQYLAQNHQDTLAVIYIDSKVDNGEVHLVNAGKNVVSLIDQFAFANGYRGQVVIAAPSTSQLDYLRAARDALKDSNYRDRYFFSIDGEEGFFRLTLNEFAKYERVMRQLIALSPNRVYSTGITSCAPRHYYDQIILSAHNQESGVVGGTGIWTIDKEDQMNIYLGFGATAIMTNRPAAALAVIRGRGERLALPGEAFQTATSDDLVASCLIGRDSYDPRDSHDPGTRLICCPNKDRFMLPTNQLWYCSNIMKSGAVCRVDEMCKSGSCKGNYWGLQDGKCT